jgi:hypothetical protein
VHIVATLQAKALRTAVARTLRKLLKAVMVFMEISCGVK